MYGITQQKTELYWKCWRVESSGTGYNHKRKKCFGEKKQNTPKTLCYQTRQINNKHNS